MVSRFFPNVEIAPCPVIPSHSASRTFHSIKSLFARCGFHHLTIFCKTPRSGEICGVSSNTLSVVRLINETPARSNSGPRGAIFLSDALPIKPLTLEVSSHKTTREYQRSSAGFVNQISKAEVGSI